MSNYSHRGYEHRTSGYGRRRHKASGFKKKSSGGIFVKWLVVLVVAAAAIALVFIFAKYLKPFLNSFNDKDKEVINTFDMAVTDSPDTPVGSFDKVDDKIYVSNGSGYVMFKGISDTAVNYSAVLNSITSSMSDDITVYNMVIPTNTEFGLGSNFKEYTNSQKDNLDRIYSALMDKVINIDLYDSFNLHKDEYIYFRTDESITALGGYYAYREFAQTAKISTEYIYSIDTLSENKGNIRRFEGEFLKRTTDEKIQPHGNQELFDNADTIDFYRIPVQYNCYRIDMQTGEEIETELFSTDNTENDSLSVFPGKDTELLKIYNLENYSDEKLLIIKDHAGEPVIGYLVPAYSEVHVVDVQLYKDNLNDYIRRNDITHVLFLSGITDANNSLYCRRLRDLFDNNISG